MPIWCPKCNAMLPEGLEECPRCGVRLGPSEKEEGISRRDVAWLSAYTIGILLIPVVIGLILALICIFVFNAR